MNFVFRYGQSQLNVYLTLVRRMSLVQFPQLFYLVRNSRKYPRLTMSRWFLLFSSSPVTTQNARSTKYELGNALKNVLPDPTREDLSP